jgi:hypothetical protein
MQQEIFVTVKREGCGCQGDEKTTGATGDM